MANDMNALFQGVPPRESRNALAEFVRENLHRFKKYYVPCAGRFAATEILIKSGVNPEKIFTSDISLLSSLLGYHYSGQKIEDLKIMIDPVDLKDFDLSGSREDTVSSLLLALKYYTIDEKQYYTRAFKKEIKRNWCSYVRKISEQIEEHNDILSGINYEVRDVMDVIDEARGAKTNFIYINPPAYKGGYTKMFDTKGEMTWDEPDIPEFDPKTYTSMLEGLTEAQATVIVYRYKDTKNVPEGWAPIFGKYYAPDRTDYLVCNKATDSKVVIRSNDEIGPSKYPLYDDSEITKWTKVRVVPINRAQATYYRDLFVHKLGAVVSENNFLMLLDGKIFTVFGIHTEVTVRRNYPYVNETYGLSIHSKRYPHINRLFMKLMTSSEFEKEFKALVNLGVVEDNVVGIKTVCLARFPEVRINHGIMKRLKKERLKNDLWKIEYYTDFWKKSYKMCIIEWLDELAKQERLKELEVNGE